MKKNILIFTKKGNDFTIMERTKMAKWLHYMKRREYSLAERIGVVTEDAKHLHQVI